ncbi:MAG: hypothetical protein AAF391_04220 [Bacteroidota bacterium]
MSAQQVMTKLLVQMVLQEALKNRQETKIFLPSSFAHRLESDLRAKTIDEITFGGYRVVYGPFKTIFAYNKIQDVQLVMSTSGDVIEYPSA